MKLHVKDITAMRQRPAVARASNLATGARLGAMLLKFTISEYYHAVLRGRKGLAGTKLGLDKDLTLHSKHTSQRCGRYSRRPKQRESPPFGTQPSSSSMALRFAYPLLSKGMRTRETYAWYYGTCTGWCK